MARRAAAVRRKRPDVTPPPASAPLPPKGPEPAESRHDRDVVLVAQCLQGDEASWAELLTRHRPLVLTIARRHGLRGDAAEDLFQATCLTMLQRLDLLRDHRSLAAWIATTATRKCWRARSRHAAHDELPEDLADPALAPDRAFADASREAAVRRSVDELGEPCRTLLTALFDEDAPYDEIASRLGLAVGSIGVYRRRCLDRLRAKLATGGWVQGEIP
jgi:RNA polymerase sigma factor (sigma-70 family)